MNYVADIHLSWKVTRTEQYNIFNMHVYDFFFNFNTQKIRYWNKLVFLPVQMWFCNFLLFVCLSVHHNFDYGRLTSNRRASTPAMCCISVCIWAHYSPIITHLLSPLTCFFRSSFKWNLAPFFSISVELKKSIVYWLLCETSASYTCTNTNGLSKKKHFFGNIFYWISNTITFHKRLNKKPTYKVHINHWLNLTVQLILKLAQNETTWLGLLSNHIVLFHIWEKNA